MMGSVTPPWPLSNYKHYQNIDCQTTEFHCISKVHYGLFVAAAELPQQMAQLSYDLIDFGLRQGHISEDFLYYDILEKIAPRQ